MGWFHFCFSTTAACDCDSQAARGAYYMTVVQSVTGHSLSHDRISAYEQWYSGTVVRSSDGEFPRGGTARGPQPPFA
jgi:hypothetical protein